MARQRNSPEESLRKIMDSCKQIKNKTGPIYERQVMGTFDYWAKEMIRLGLDSPYLHMQ